MLFILTNATDLRKNTVRTVVDYFGLMLNRTKELSITYHKKVWRKLRK